MNARMISNDVKGEGDVCWNVILFAGYSVSSKKHQVMPVLREKSERGRMRPNRSVSRPRELWTGLSAWKVTTTAEWKRH